MQSPEHMCDTPLPWQALADHCNASMHRALAKSARDTPTPTGGWTCACGKRADSIGGRGDWDCRTCQPCMGAGRVGLDTSWLYAQGNPTKSVPAWCGSQACIGAIIAQRKGSSPTRRADNIQVGVLCCVRASAVRACAMPKGCCSRTTRSICSEHSRGHSTGFFVLER